MIPYLKKGNCFIFSCMFRHQNPGAIILCRWNYKSNVISFSAVHNGKRFFYKRKNRTENKYWFEGKIVIINL